jgi:hypothetical protein
VYFNKSRASVTVWMHGVCRQCPAFQNGLQGLVGDRDSIRLQRVLFSLCLCACCLLQECPVRVLRWSPVNVHFKQRKRGHFEPSPVTAADFIVTWRVIGLFCLMGSQVLDHNLIYTAVSLFCMFTPYTELPNNTLVIYFKFVERKYSF